MRAAVAGLGLSLALAGCDEVIGLDEAPTPCPATGFSQASSVDLMTAEAFSVSLDRTVAIVALDGKLYEQPLPSGTPAALPALVYNAHTLALAPEGDALLYTADIEPPLLMAAVRQRAGWQPDEVVPAGLYAGTPSAAGYGLRRVLVRLVDAGAVQEYEQSGNRWVTVSAPQNSVDGDEAPNLTPDGLTMVYGGTQGVMLAVRKSTSDAFTPAVEILPGAHAHPQLLDHCQQLFTVDAAASGSGTVVRRYDL